MPGSAPAADRIHAPAPRVAAPGLQAAALLALIVALLVLRNHAVVSSPRFWAEEADLLFANAWLLPGADALWTNTTLRSGYLNVFPVVATWLAAKLVALELAPAFALVAVALVQGSALLLALAGPRSELASPLQRALVAAVLLWFPYHHGLLETWLSVMNASVHFGVVALLILLADERREGRGWRIASRLLLGIGAVTGPYTFVLAPLFVLKWLHLREREQLVRALVVGVAAAVQGSLALGVLAGGEITDTRELGGLAASRPYVAVVFQVLYAIAGEIPGHMLLAGLRLLPENPALGWGAAGAALGVVAAIALGAWLVAARGYTRTALLGAFATWFVFTTLFAVKGLAGYRYAVCPSIAFGLLLLHAATGPGSARRAGRGVLATLLAAGIASGIAEWLLLPGPMTGQHQADWRGEIAAWRRDPDHRVRAWPSSVWYTHLAAPARRDALVRALERAPGTLTLRQAGGAVSLPLDADGLPAYFAIRFEACAAAGGELGLVGRSAQGVALVAHREALAPGCAATDLNSMTLAFAGFRDFSRVASLDLSYSGPAGAEATLADFHLTTPVLTVAHPLSGD